MKKLAYMLLEVMKLWRLIQKVDNWLKGLKLQRSQSVLLPFVVSHEQLVAISDDAEAVFTSGPGETTLKVWNCDWSSKTLIPGSTIPIVQPASTIECKIDNSNGDGLVILTVLESGLTYLWKFESLEVELINVKVEPIYSGVETLRKKRKSISAARLKSIEANKQVMVLTVTGSTNSPQFNVSTCEPGEDVACMSGSINEEEVLAQKGVEMIENVPIEDDPTEPTMGEKLERLSLLHDGSMSNVQQEALPPEQPRADSVVVLLKQALCADDRALLLDCLYNRN